MASGIITLLGVMVFLYLTWRNLYDNYKDEKLISYSWLALMVMLVSGRITYGLLNWGVLNDSLINWFQIFRMPGFNYPGGIIGAVAFSVWYAAVNGWKVWSFMEDVTPSAYLFLAFLAGEEYVKSGYSIQKLYYMIVAVAGYLLANWVKGRYRSMVWYKSGKKGFVFFFVMFLTGMMLLLVGLLYNDGPVMQILYLSICLISGLGLFILGEVFSNLIIFRRINAGKR